MPPSIESDVPPSLSRVYSLHLSLNQIGWGPDHADSTTVSSCLHYTEKYPFEPSLKPDRLGRVCDFTFSSYQRQQRDGYGAQDGRWGRGGNYTVPPGLEEEMKFHTVDTRPLPKMRTMTRYRHQRKSQKQSTQAFQQKQQLEKDDKLGRQKRAAQKKQQAAQQARFQRIYNRHRTFAEWSIQPTPKWTVEAEISLSQLPKQTTDSSKIQVEDIGWRGTLRFYNKQMDKITPKQATPVQPMGNTLDFYWVSTTDDEILKQLILECPNPSKPAETSADGTDADKEGTSFADIGDTIYVAATDQVLSCLMASPQAKYSWHLNITKIGNKLLLDKADGSIVDLLTVNETAPEPPMQDDANKLNRPPALGFEAAKINQNVRQQLLMKKEEVGGVADQYEEAPFVEPGDNPASIAYRYRRFTLPGRPTGPAIAKAAVVVLTRAEVHAKLPPLTKTVPPSGASTPSASAAPAPLSANATSDPASASPYIYMCAINEFDLASRKNWSSHIDTQKGALLATEIRNNSNKFQKWVASALVGGCDHLRLGYVTRKLPNSNDRHNLLCVQSHMTKEIGMQIGLKADNAWGIVRSMVDMFMDREDGRYVLLKDPMKPIMRLYKRPADDEDDEEEAMQVEIQA
eukprot:GHVQ01040156.1.p1 GENE.GHVQ01040156.1~~GHVQ01040156.1.p1  ORF type:complete len:629 (+),score=122.67 GHVQ01040156.1:72-1958(+)